MARRQATFSVENVVGQTSDELYRRTVALYNKLFAKTPSPPAEVARAKPRSPTRKAPQAAAAVAPPPPPQPSQQQVSSRPKLRWSDEWHAWLYGDVEKEQVDAPKGQKRKRGGGQWNNYASNNGGGERGACFRCGEFGHKKEECPLKNKGKSV